MSIAFTDAGDWPNRVRRPKTESVDPVAAERRQTVKIAPADLILRHCQAFGALEQGERLARPSARERLEQVIGPDLTRRLLVSLSPSSRH